MEKNMFMALSLDQEYQIDWIDTGTISNNWTCTDGPIYSWSRALRKDLFTLTRTVFLLFTRRQFWLLRFGAAVESLFRAFGNRSYGGTRSKARRTFGKYDAFIRLFGWVTILTCFNTDAALMVSYVRLYACRWG